MGMGSEIKPKATLVASAYSRSSRMKFAKDIVGSLRRQIAARDPTVG